MKLIDAWVRIGRTERESNGLIYKYFQGSAEYPFEIAERVSKDYYANLADKGAADGVSELWVTVDYEAYGGVERLSMQSKTFRVGIETRLVFDAKEVME